MAKQVGISKQISVGSKRELVEALERLDELQEQIAPLENEASALKVAATKYATSRGLDVVQLDGRYWRRVRRSSRRWVGTEEEMPEKAPKGAQALSELVRGRYVTRKGKKIALWNLLTKRVPDPERIDAAIKAKQIKLDEIEAAYVEIPQAEFLQRYQGEADAN